MYWASLWARMDLTVAVRVYISAYHVHAYCRQTLPCDTRNKRIRSANPCNECLTTACADGNKYVRQAHTFLVVSVYSEPDLSGRRVILQHGLRPIRYSMSSMSTAIWCTQHKATAQHILFSKREKRQGYSIGVNVMWSQASYQAAWAQIIQAVCT